MLEVELAALELERARRMRMIPSRGYMYLASPYSHPDPFVRETRYLWAMKELTHALKMGIHVYSPIVHCHELAKIADLPRDAKFWELYNFTMLAAAEQLWVLMIPGWQESKGIAGEIEEAKRVGIQVMQIEPKETL